MEHLVTDIPTDPPERRLRHRRAKKLRWALLSGGLAVLLTAGGGAAWALERFVIPHVQISDVKAYQEEQQQANPATDTTEAGMGETGTTSTNGGDAASTATAATDPVITDTSYTSDDASISITTQTTGSGADTVTAYVADVTLTDATVLQSAFAQNQFGENITDLVSNIAGENGAVFAINGDYYGFRNSGIVIRNGVVFRDSGAREGLVFYKDGTAAVYDETTTSADELIANGAWNTLSFGPAIVEDGAVVDGIESVEIDTNFGNHSIQGTHPRTAIGVIDVNHIVFVVVDGRNAGYSRGASLTELATIMTDLGVQTAYNLDGGGSAEMWFNGEVVNQPSNGGERATSDILYIGG